MDSSSDNSDSDYPSSSPPPKWHNIPASKVIFQARKFLIAWNEDWGPPSCWSPHICKYFEECIADDPAGENLHEWRTFMAAKADEGRIWIRRLERVYKTMPRKHSEVQDLWLQALDLVRQFQVGTSCLEAHVDLLFGR